MTLIVKRGKFALVSYPQRLVRLWDTAWKEGDSIHIKFLKLVFLFGDVLFMPEMYESLTDFVKWRTRSLTDVEKNIGASVFRDLLPWDMIRIDEKASLGPKKYNFAYVSFFTINSFGPLQRHIFIHELMHVFHYLKFGSAYIPMALMAQRSLEKYNYGGLRSLEKLLLGKKGIWDLNLEQQAEVLSDYFLLRIGENPKWGSATIADLEIYERFVYELYGFNPKDRC